MALQINGTVEQLFLRCGPLFDVMTLQIEHHAGLELLESAASAFFIIFSNSYELLMVTPPSADP